MNRISFPNDIIDLSGENVPKDFKIIYKEQKFKCNSGLAALFSSKIQYELLSDSLITEYEIKKLPVDGSIKHFADFFCGNFIEYDTSETVFLFIVSTFLGIDFLENELHPLILSDLKDQSEEVIINQIIFLFENGGNITAHLIALADILNEDIFNDFANKVQPPVIDQLFNIIEKNKKLNENHENFIINTGGRLLRHLNIASLNKKRLKDLITSKSTNLNYLRKGISELAAHLSYKPPPISYRYVYHGEPFNGIINSLSEKCHGNPALKHLIAIKAYSNPKSSSSNNINNIFDLNNSKNFYKSKSNEPLWFIIDFNSECVKIDGYSIKASLEGSLCPCNWTLSGSNDDDKWEKIDEQNDIKFDNPDGIKVFVLLQKTPKYRYIKFNHPAIPNEKNGIGIISFELFGYYYP